MSHPNELLLKSFKQSTTPMGRPLSMSSQDSEDVLPPSSNPSPFDIAMLEKDSEILARKAAKRFKKNYSTQSESFVEKFISWHRKKKVDKIKTSLESLFPKLKNSEQAVKHWLSTVSEKKEVAWLNGNALLYDLESQVTVYQKHLDFLDEVVNDIRQIDYDIVREVSELKIAFAFNQEMIVRASPKVNTATVPNNFGAGRVDCAEASKTLLITVDGAAEGDEKGTSFARDLEQEHVDAPDCAALPSPTLVLTAEPAVWHGFKTAPASTTNTTSGVNVKAVSATADAAKAAKPFSKSITALFTSIGGSHGASSHTASVEVKAGCVGNADSHAHLHKKLKDLNAADGANVLINKSGRISPKATPSGSRSRGPSPCPRPAELLRSSSASPRLEDATSQEVTWDGAESKRRSLNLSNVSLQSLKLGLPVDSPTCAAAKAGSSWRLSSSHSEKAAKSSSSSSNFLSASLTRGRSGTAGSADDARAPSKQSQWSSPPSIQRNLAAQPYKPQESINHCSSQSSSDESTNSHSDGDSEECVGILTIGSSDSMGSAGARDRQASLPKKLSLQKLLQKVESRDADMDALAHDPDQVEMAKRIKRCLALKDTLKSVLATVQLTQDSETCALKKMRKLRNELKLICSAELDPNLAREGQPNFCCLYEQKLQEICQSSCNGSGSNSVTDSSSHPNLQCLGSDHGSDDSIGQCGLSHDTRDSHSLSTPPLTDPHGAALHSKGSLARRRSISPPHMHAASANIPIIPPVHRMTPSQSAAVAASGVAAFSFVTTATTGSDQGAEEEAAEERLSIGSNSSFGGDQEFQDLAAVCVDGLKSLIQEENEAREKLAKLTALINNANSINQQLKLNVATADSASK